MNPISLERFIHNSRTCIALKFPFDFKTKEYIKKFTGVLWTNTHRTFYIYYDEVRLEDLKAYIKDGGIRIIKDVDDNEIPRQSKGESILLKPLTKEKIVIYREFLRYLEGKRFSNSTISY